MDKKVIIIGASGHAKVVADIVESSNDKVVGFLDDNIPFGTKVLDYSVFGKVDDAIKISRGQSELYFIIAIGNNQIRKDIADKYLLNYYTAIHSTAIISKHSKISNGSVICAGAVIGVDTYIGKHCIINTNASVDHDCNVNDFVHMCPNATTSGGVTIGFNTLIGVGAKVINNIKIGSKAILGAGSVVIKDIPNNCTAVGVPAKVIKEN